MGNFKEIAIKITTSTPGRRLIMAPTAGGTGRDIVEFTNQGGKFIYTESIIVPDDAIVEIVEV